MSANFEDEDTPPELIDVTAIPADQTSVDEEPTARVPITLVTGMNECILIQVIKETNVVIRLPGSRENNPVKPYLDRKTRQENCRDHERFVCQT